MGRVAQRPGSEYAALLDAHFAGIEPPGARQIVVLDVDLVQTSCGFGVPFFSYEGERTTLARWAETKCDAELEAYRREKNAHSLDGFPTGFDAETELAAVPPGVLDARD
jgi:hypothetical protein